MATIWECELLPLAELLRSCAGFEALPSGKSGYDFYLRGVSRGSVIV